MYFLFQMYQKEKKKFYKICSYMIQNLNNLAGASLIGLTV